MSPPPIPNPDRVRLFLEEHAPPRELPREAWVAKLLPSRFLALLSLASAATFLLVAVSTFAWCTLDDARFLWSRTIDLEVWGTRYFAAPTSPHGDEPGLLHFEVVDAPPEYAGPRRGSCYITRGALNRTLTGPEALDRLLSAEALAADPSISRVEGGSVSGHAAVGWIFLATLGPFAVAGFLLGGWLLRLREVRRRLLERGRLRAARLGRIDRGEQRVVSPGPNRRRAETRVLLEIVGDEERTEIPAWAPTSRLEEFTSATDRDSEATVCWVLCDPERREAPWPIEWLPRERES